MSGLAITPPDILRFGLRAAQRGEDIILVTLVGIDGSSPRALGAQMIVTSDGSCRGSFSGGCVEAAIVAESLDVLSVGVSRLMRFGAGSPYIDIRLPCGGGIDLLFTPRPDPTVIAEILASLDARRRTAIRIAPDGLTSASASCSTMGWDGDAFDVAFVPRLRLLAFGHGDALVAAAQLGHYFGADSHAFTPSREDMTALSGDGINAVLLGSRASIPALESDAWTAFAFLFHDHDWEDRLLPLALRTPHLFVGAIGGEQSRRNRLAMLRSKGFEEAELRAFASPAGLIPATRDPATLALSIIAQIVGVYQASLPHPLRSEKAFEAS